MMAEGMRGKVALWSLLWLLGWARPAFAGPPPVNVTLEACPNLNPAEVERIFSAELGSANPGVSDPTVTEVTITCEGERVVIRVKDPLSRKTVQRSFDTSAFDPKATPRLIALAASELVLASWAELYSNPQPTVEPEGPKPTPDDATAVRKALRELAFFREEPEPPTPATAADEPEERVLRVLGLFSLRGFPEDDSSLMGGGLRVGEERFRLVGWSLDTLIERGTLIAHAGETITKSEATSWTIGGALLAYYSYKQFVTVRLGVGLRAGAVFADKPRVAPWGWPLGVSVITFRAQSFVMDFSGEGGYVAFPASGGEVSGFWLSGQVGMGMVL
jgi:hypothetical protein